MMRLAFVHDWFKANGGAEKVAGDILDLYQHEDVTVYTLFNKFSPADKKEILKDDTVKTSLLQYIPFIAKIYRYTLPIMPWRHQFSMTPCDGLPPAGCSCRTGRSGDRDRTASGWRRAAGEVRRTPRPATHQDLPVS